MSSYVWGDQETAFFYNLEPEVILSAIEKLGFATTGRCMALNSMENRVYEIEIETESEHPSDHFVIAKFYRPGRWNADQILEEHAFLLELEEDEIPVIAPKVIGGQTLFTLDDPKLFYCLYRKQGGRAPQDMNTQQLQILGRLLARMHNVGNVSKAAHRITMDPDTFGSQNIAYLEKENIILPHYAQEYLETAKSIVEISKPLFEGVHVQRIHGDCHWGNVIYREDMGMFFIDFDDMVVGPPVQDIWLLVPGDDTQAIADRNTLLEAYESMRDFDYGSLKLIEPLRTFRYMHFSAWISKRWEDPAFKKAFPFYGTDQYWGMQVQDLKIQHQKIQNVIAQSAMPGYI